jgi:NitT/TauT family transport system ATP-binding protein
MRESGNYLLVGRERASRPDPAQAAWLYAQMVRWGQAGFSAEALKAAMSVFRPDLYDSALKAAVQPSATTTISAFTGPAFNPDDTAGYLASFKVFRRTP